MAESLFIFSDYYAETIVGRTCDVDEVTKLMKDEWLASGEEITLFNVNWTILDVVVVPIGNRHRNPFQKKFKRISATLGIMTP